MRQGAHNWSVFTRSVVLAVIAAAGIATIVGSTGGGGDGDDDGDGSAELLSSYNIQVDRAVDKAGSETDGITVTLDEDGTPTILRVDPNPVVGQYMCDQTTEICELSRIGLDGINTFLYVFDESDPQIVGNLVIQIPQQVIISTLGQPIIGIVRVHSLPIAEGGLGEGFIDVNLDTLCPDVEIFDDSVSLGCYTWNEFEALFETSETPAEQLASFGFQALGFLFEQVDLATGVLGLIDGYEAELDQAGTITEMCDAFSDAGLAAPTNIANRVVPNEGMRALQWIDGNSDGRVGPGDDFVGTLTECWVDDPTDDIDEILDGTGYFYSYVENVDQNREVITAIGFTAVKPPNPGGVIYSGFSISETEQVSPPDQPTEIIDVIEIQGGISVLFTEP